MKLYSWGSNSHGQLGLGSQIEQTEIPNPIYINVKVKYITGGGKHTVLLTSNSELYSCGDNDKGQLGKDPTLKSLFVFQPLHFPRKIIKVSCGWDFNLILTENSEVWGWGSNSFGQLGLPVKKVSHASHPCRIFERKAIAIGAGLRHSAIVTLDGLVYTSGFGRKGQLGVLVDDKIPTNSDKFIEVKNITNCTEVTCGECHCVVKTGNGEYYSWGNNKYGQLGVDYKTTTSSCPIKINLPFTIDQSRFLASGWAHNCILTGKGELVTWGRNDFGQLGEERLLTWMPEIVKNLRKIKQVCLGSHHTVVLTEKGEVVTWGWNEHGNCGTGSCDNVKNPYKIKESKEIELIGSGAAHSFYWSD